MAQFFYEHISQRYGKAKYISIEKSTPTQETLVSGVQRIISINNSEGSMLVSAHASTVHAE